jgi:hypothetical protein
MLNEKYFNDRMKVIRNGRMNHAEITLEYLDMY